MGELSGICTHPKHKQEIENVYEHTCEDWIYWHPYLPYKPEESWVGKKCKSCKHCERV